MNGTSTIGAPQTGSLKGVQGSPALCCVISIGRDATGLAPTGLRVFPSRADDSHIYYPKANALPRSQYPQEMAWVVNHLMPGERIRITAKQEPAQPNLFSTNTFEIVYPDQYATTGPVVHGARNGNSYGWAYNVELLGGSLPVPVLDPTVIVTEEP